jgi:twitching motility protein PilT
MTAPAQSTVSLRTLLDEMIERDASDLHVSAGGRPKLRVDGEIVNASLEHVLTPRDTLQLAYSVLTENQKKRFEMEDELDFSFGIANLSRFRGNVFKQRGCVSMVIRRIPFQIKTFADLQLPAVIARFAERPRGLVLVTGPTGSGKSTTLAAMIDKINTERRGHIITVEDPIEFIHRHRNCIINQREVGADTKSFASALKYALREDPDVILIGEMRDAETIDTAMKAAETGHLLISTLHTPDAQSTIMRIVAMFPPEEQAVVRMRLAESLHAVVSQRLLPRKSGQGRVVAAEVMIVTSTIRDLIAEGNITEIRDYMADGAQYGMQTFDQHLTELVNSGEVDFEVAKNAATNPADFELSFRMGRSAAPAGATGPAMASPALAALPVPPASPPVPTAKTPAVAPGPTPHAAPETRPSPVPSPQGHDTMSSLTASVNDGFDSGFESLFGV